jgi:plasmid maintenance system killer protein
MDIIFRTSKLEKECNDRNLLQKRQGQIRAKLIQRRLDDLRAAEVLEDMRNIPGRCHELRGNRAEQLSLDLDGPYRLIFEPANDPVPKKADGGLNWNQVTAVRIIDVEDTHE